MPDQRTAIEKRLDETIGPPLYYCAECMRAVKVTPIKGAEPKIERPCTDGCSNQIIAPRKSILHGEGGLNFKGQTIRLYLIVAAALTGRCV